MDKHRVNPPREAQRKDPRGAKTPGSAARAVVQRWLKEAGAHERTDSYAGKRDAPRMGWERAIQLRHKDKVCPASIRDVSPSGIGLTCRLRLKQGDAVFLRELESDPWISCRVAHCTATIGTFKIGVAPTFDVA